MNDWQHRWENEDRGRITYSFNKEVGLLENREWFVYAYRTTCFLTGHGFFRENLERFGLAESPLCPCGELQGSDHLLMNCSITAEARRRTLAGDPPVDCAWYLQNKNNFNKFQDLVDEIFKLHEEEMV